MGVQEPVRLEYDKGVARVNLNWPEKRNALSPALGKDSWRCSSVDDQGVAHSPSSIVEICGSRRSVVGGRILEGATL
jgi:hypothetical protein